jgi:hypothetical protein
MEPRSHGAGENSASSVSQYVSLHFAFMTLLNHRICKVLSSSIDKVLTPRRVGALKEVKSIACGAHHTLALCGGGSIGSGSSLKVAQSHSSSSSVFAFGRGSSGELGCGQCVVCFVCAFRMSIFYSRAGTTANSATPCLVKALQGRHVLQIAAGAVHR